MNCSNCGGGLQPVGNRNYFRCPYCQTFHYSEETDDGVAVIGDDARRDCPVCETPLLTAAVGGHAVGHCPTCRGLLATNETFGQVVRLKRAATQSVPPPIPFDPTELDQRLRCPGCGKRMDRHPYHAGGNAVIDTCYRCRLVWLDAGELAVIGRYPAANS